MLAAMGMEWRAIRRALSATGNPAQVVRCGIGLQRWSPPKPPQPAFITCGLAGGLRSDLPPGTVVVAGSVAMEDGEPVACDPDWVAALVAGARACGHEPVVGPVLTARRLVLGDARDAWAGKGFVAAEMETALLVPTGQAGARRRRPTALARGDVAGGAGPAVHTAGGPLPGRGTERCARLGSGARNRQQDVLPVQRAKPRAWTQVAAVNPRGRAQRRWRSRWLGRGPG